MNFQGLQTVEMFSCSICSTSFSDWLSLWKHVEESHKKLPKKQKKKKKKKKKEKREPVEPNPPVVGVTKKSCRKSCNLCPRSFNKTLQLQKHKNTTHLYGCKFCKEILHNESRLSEHLKSKHLYRRVYFCDLCSHHVPTRMDLANHKLTVHENKSHQVVQVNFEQETEDEELTDEDWLTSQSENEEPLNVRPFPPPAPPVSAFQLNQLPAQPPTSKNKKKNARRKMNQRNRLLTQT